MKIPAHTYLKSIIGLSIVASLTACNMPADSDVRAGANTQEAARAAPPAPAICSDCGTIASIDQVKEKGSASGIGAVVGAAAGAVIGHQVGDGRGNDAATATGAIGGGIAGHQIEKRINGTTYFHVTVAMEGGGTRSVDVETLNGLTVGSKVKVVGNNLHVAG